MQRFLPSSQPMVQLSAEYRLGGQITNSNREALKLEMCFWVCNPPSREKIPRFIVFIEEA